MMMTGVVTVAIIGQGQLPRPDGVTRGDEVGTGYNRLLLTCAAAKES